MNEGKKEAGDVMAIEAAELFEKRRLADLQAYAVLDTPAEPQFDDLARLAAQICQTPLAAVSLVDATRVWFKSRHGLPTSEICRDGAFCSAAIQTPDQITIIPDTAQD